MAKKKARTDLEALNVEDYRHSGSKRKNIPPAKIAAEGKVPPMPKIEYSYSPRRPPVLRFDPTGKADKLPELLEKATKGPLSKEEAEILAEAIRNQQPWLEWAGKQEAEAKGFSVDPVALHIHERISAQAILKIAARKDVERTLFSDPEQDYHEAVQFYKHDIDWTNRLILGDSAQVMASLAHREDLAGKVQMIYMDPPYGIRYGSNFQPTVGRRDVKDNITDLTRELEMVKAYRDTWNLGIHSYLRYLRDRMILARDLLNETGSIFVQISDENLHRVRMLLDDVFGANNFIGLITVRTGSGFVARYIKTTSDYLIWYGRNSDQTTFNRLFVHKNVGDETYFDKIQTDDGTLVSFSSSENKQLRGVPVALRPLVSAYSENTNYKYDYNGRQYYCGSNRCWKTTPDGMDRLTESQRIHAGENTLKFIARHDDFPYTELSHVWEDTMELVGKSYAVQTATKVVQRCVLMTTNPGDLVIDPTCGSGTTAYIAEQWGRRWISIDTSRVALAIARQRILTAKFEYYKLKPIDQAGRETKGLRDSTDGNQVACSLKYLTAPHITLKAIAKNPYLDTVIERYRPVLDKLLDLCNKAVSSCSLDIKKAVAAKLSAKQKRDGKKSITDADNRRWNLPKKGEKFEHWTVPFDTDPDWSTELQNAVTEYRKAWRAKMDEVNACIAANASQEELVDQPEIVKGIVRVSGPFTVESVQPPEESLTGLDGMFDGAPDQLEDTFDTKNVESYLDQMTRLLKLDGVRFPDNKDKIFSRLERLTGQSGGLHAEGRWCLKGTTDDDPEGKATVAVGFGPQYGPVTAKQVEDLIRTANRRGYDALVIAGFSFDGPAQASIKEASHPNLQIHMASIRPDINPGMAGLLKEQPGSQLFTVFGQPRTRIEGPNKEGEYTVYMEGVDIYDPVSNTIRSTEDSKVAAWFLDADYDGRTFCITQAFFPDRSAWDKLANALGGVVSDDAFEKLSGVVSLPFPLGKHKCVAVKVIDPRGNEVMQVHNLGDSK